MTSDLVVLRFCVKTEPDEYKINCLTTMIERLQNENATLRADNALLRAKLGAAAWRVDGHSAETFIAALIGGELTRGSAPYDFRSSSKVNFEIKFSRRNAWKTPRWNWRHILGVNGCKQFDRLLLLGEPDPVHRWKCKDHDSPYAIFDVPFDEVRSLMESDNLIWINTNPASDRRATHRALFSRYQSTCGELAERYGVSERRLA